MPAPGKALTPEKRLDIILEFRKYRNMRKPDPLLVTRSADRFSALGAEPRLQILRLLLAAHPDGMVAGEVQEELGIPAYPFASFGKTETGGSRPCAPRE